MSACVALVALMQIAVPRSDATVAGRVRDAETGRPLPGATVAAPGIGQASVTDAHGHYTLSRLPSGPQSLSVRLIGHVPYSLHAVVPRQGTLELNVALTARPNRLPEVHVRQSGERAESARNAIDRGASRIVRAIDLARHPQLAEPDFLRALVGGDVVAAAETPGGLHVRGGASDHTAYSVDGVPVFNPYHASDLMGGWNTDALASARLTSGLAATSTLSGEVQLTSRSPSETLTTRGAVSTTHARFTMDGPTGVGRSTFLISARTAFPAALAPADDPTFIRGRSRDWLGKFETPLGSGMLRALMLYSADRVNLSSSPPTATGEASLSPNNTFHWANGSSALQWRTRRGVDSVELSAWRSGSDVRGSWDLRTLSLASHRTDQGMHVTLSRRTSGATSSTGARLVRSSTAYRVDGNGTANDMGAASLLLTAFIATDRMLTRSVGIDADASAVLFQARGYLSPRVRGYWSVNERLSVSGTVLRRHQFAQSMRNAESTVGYVFPADLLVGARRGMVPVARSDELSFVADLAPTRALHTRVGGYTRQMDDVVMVAPVEDAPFLRGSPSFGEVTARGVYAEADLRIARVAFLARYGVQHVRYHGVSASYVPNFGARSQLDGGVSVFPTASTMIRLGLTAALGRQVTPATGSFEWESCNLKDRGCEFAGTPRADPTLTGRSSAPQYVRVDLGLRHNRQMRFGSRNAEMALFGTFSNILNRFNVLTYTIAEGATQPVEMRPRAPLVIGLDWRF